MFKETITYTDYNGVERKEDFYFNLSQAELAEMELGMAGGMSAMITRIIDSRDDTEIMKIFKSLILASYGEKSADGKYFNKGEEISRKFTCTEAYSQLFMRLATDSEYAVAFVKGIIPNDANIKENALAA